MIIPATAKEVIESLIATRQISTQFILNQTGLSENSFSELMKGKEPEKEVEEALLLFYCQYQLMQENMQSN